MMKLSYNSWMFFCALVGLLSSMFGDSDAATYVVGDSLGWTVPPNPSAYATWASQHTLTVGDVLVFNYTTGFHDVAKVGKQAYDSCASSNPIALVTVGPASFTLNSTGSDYYICTFGQHCSLGQKLEINVASSSSPSPSPSPIPSPSNPAAPTPMPQPPSSVSPGPAPSGTMVPPPISPGSESSPRPPPSDLIPTNNQPPAPPPNSAPLVAVGSPAVALACVVFGLLIIV